MHKIKVFDPSQKDEVGVFRGGGRWVNLLKDLCKEEMQFVSSLSHINSNDHLLIPSWNPFEKPLMWRKHAKTQSLVIFDTIPFKYPENFPLGFRGSVKAVINKYLLSLYDNFITISEHAKADIIRQLGIPESRITVIYPTTSEAFFTKKNTQENPLKNPYVMYVGDVNWNKNLLNLARAIKIAKVPCMFVGKPFEAEKLIPEAAQHPWQHEFHQFIAEFASNNEDRDLFMFKGYVPDDELTSLYQHAAANVLVSRDEGFGLSYLEASTQKCPSVLSETEIFREIAGNGTDSTADDAALFAQPEDPYHIAEKITELTSKPELRNELGKKAHANAQRFSPGQFKKSFSEFIQKTTSRGFV